MCRRALAGLAICGSLVVGAGCDWGPFDVSPEPVVVTVTGHEFQVGEDYIHDHGALRPFLGLDTAGCGRGAGGLDAVVAFADVRISPDAIGVGHSFPLDLIGVPPRHGDAGEGLEVLIGDQHCRRRHEDMKHPTPAQVYTGRLLSR